MRPLALLLPLLLLAPAAATGPTVDLLVDGGTFSYACEDLPVSPGTTLKAALEACRARHGFSTAYAFGGCFLDAVDGRRTLAADPLWLVLLFWHVRVDALAASSGICEQTLAGGEIVTFGYEPGTAWAPNGAVPLPTTVAWIALHLA